MGAVISCIFGLFVLLSSLIAISEMWQDIIRNPWNFLAAFIEAVFLFFAFAPAIMFFRSRKTEMTRLSFIIIGAMELIAILLFIGMLFPAL